VVVGGICNNRRLLYTECYHPLKHEWITLSDISTSHASMHSYRWRVFTNLRDYLKCQTSDGVFLFRWYLMISFIWKGILISGHLFSNQSSAKFCCMACWFALVRMRALIYELLQYKIYDPNYERPISFVVSVCSHKNDIYITGGHSNSGITVDAVSVYFSNINQWSPLASMNHPRERHGCASVDGAVYVAGSFRCKHHLQFKA